MALIVFSDLDGTLLDHGSYAWAPAAPALDALRARGVPLVLATSKTSAEVASLHAELKLGDTPAIVENGAGLYRPGAQAQGGDDYARIRQALANVTPDLRASFEGFGDVDAARIAEMTGLSEDAAALAQKRLFSEPGRWTGTAADLSDFKEMLAVSGIEARYGGRFLTLSLGRTKADAMAEVKADLGGTTTIALGDAPNDIEMLEAADRAVIVRNDHGTGLPHLAGEDTGRIRRTKAPGPTGWAEAVLALLDELDKDASHG
ncbi:mannosyl-3-phosphoglycerate phosphatase [Sagittula marina]|uniref:Mannosyl-3-phosphoglycerate phosphatase n=1 Tax=Sagittula marina TaxID=943940 RepID=A0A7W6DXD7_9RHOB|nr:HAD-IIB family hydrolase [Sagittula marina]MBB3986999.1 mannosyl-3-phosphoglycerate phosphatase [Sagittula marina]